MSISLTKKALRSRSAPRAVTELLLISNNLPRWPQAKEIEQAQQRFSKTNKPPKVLSEIHAHDRLLNANEYGKSYEWTHIYLKDAVERLPPKLQAFVVQDLEPKVDKNGMLSLELDERWGQFGPHLLDYALDIHRFVPHRDEAESMRLRYLFLFAVRDILRCLAWPDVVDSDAKTRWQEAGIPPVLSDPQTWFDRVSESFLPIYRLYSRVDVLRSYPYVTPKPTSEGTHKLAVHNPIFFQILEEIEVERIRECPICESLFWAGRLDQAACSARCSNVKRGRAWRKKYHETYKEKRRQTRGVLERNRKKESKHSRKTGD